LEKLGYLIKFNILDTCKLTGIPQHRERIYIVGFLDKSHYNKFDFNFAPKEIRPICEFLEKDIPSKYYYDSSSKIYEKLKENMVKPGTFYQYRRTLVRENKSGVCPTLTANMGTGGHNVPLLLDGDKIRKLTPRECFNFQGFPRDYNLNNLSDAKLYQLAGNAITANVLDLIVKKILECTKEN